MNASLKFAISAAFACGLSALAPSAASAMPVADVGLAPATEEAHAVRVCSRGRCWWTTAGHRHGGYWGRPYRGWHGHGWGWRGHGWRGHGWHGGHHGWGWHGGHRGWGWHGGHGRRWR